MPMICPRAILRVTAKERKARRSSPCVCHPFEGVPAEGHPSFNRCTTGTYYLLLLVPLPVVLTVVPVSLSLPRNSTVNVVVPPLRVLS